MVSLHCCLGVLLTPIQLVLGPSPPQTFPAVMLPAPLSSSPHCCMVWGLCVPGVGLCLCWMSRVCCQSVFSSLLRSLWVTLQRISHSCSSIQAFWYLCLIFYPVIWTDLECWRCNSWKSNSSPGLPFPPGLPLHMIVFVHAKVCSPEVHSGGPAICLVPSSRECELHHLISQYYSQSSLPQPDLHCL